AGAAGVVLAVEGCFQRPLRRGGLGRPGRGSGGRPPGRHGQPGQQGLFSRLKDAFNGR
ncbi:hypothetical protein GTW59_04270, partial [Streptomyces sp. SID89]|nr:hypothetical protein [Streptomyces sp. SID89]